MQFRAPPPPQVRAARPAKRPSSSDRDCPLVTAGDRCLWHAGGTTGEDDVARRGSHGLQLQRRGRSVQGDTSLVGKCPEGARQSRRSAYFDARSRCCRQRCPWQGPPDGPNRIPEGVVASRNEDREQIAGWSWSWVTPSEPDESRLLFFEGWAAQLKSGGVKRRGGRGRRRPGAVAEQDAVGRRVPPRPATGSG